jgi:hypothetical protein
MFTQCYIELKSLPLPAGQVIKYRVSSKYFNRNNVTSEDNSLYNLLTQIHYNGNQVSEVSTNNNNNRESDGAATFDVATNEPPEVKNFFKFSYYWLIMCHSLIIFLRLSISCAHVA